MPSSPSAEAEATAVHAALDDRPVHFRPTPLPELPAKARLPRPPAYAPWANPVERVWRKPRQEELHTHRRRDDWGGLTAEVDAGLECHAGPGPALLRYTGLSTA